MTDNPSRRQPPPRGPRRARPAGAITAYFDGVRLLGRGLGLYARRPGLLLLGIVPVLLTAVLFVAIFAVLLFFLGDLAALTTWFADDWGDAPRSVARIVAGIAIVGVTLLIGIVTFTSVALTIGDPFYERISRRVEQWCGGVTGEVEVGWWRSFGQSLADSLRVVAITAATGAVLFFAGFFPALGQTVVPLLGATVAGWYLSVELVSIPFNRRGLRLRDRMRALRAHRPLALGFGTAVFVCFLIPGGAVLAMPAAVAGGTLLARRVLDLPHTT